IIFLKVVFIFFFSSRRRHTRFSRDWSSDVCSSDLRQARWAARRLGLERVRFEELQIYDLARSEERWDLVLFMGVFYHLRYPLLRSEERRVGKECRGRDSRSTVNKDIDTSIRNNQMY